MRSLRVLFFSLAFLVASVASTLAQHQANSNATYQQLRNMLPGPDIISINSLEVRRDAATFTFTRGDFAFYGAVNGKVTGAVFMGAGHLHLAPPTQEERHNLRILNHSDEFDEDFDYAVLRFTDGTDAELRTAAASKAQADDMFQRRAQEWRAFQRQKMLENIDLRLLEDAFKPAPGGFFQAGIHGKKNAHLVYTLDPHGARRVTPEEVSLVSWTEEGETYLCAFPSNASGRAANTEDDNATYHVSHEDLEVSIEKSGFLAGLATVQLQAAEDGLAVVRLSLYPTLRVSRVEDDHGQPMDFVQEKKDEDADFGVILPHPLKKGETVTLRIAYGGKDVVANEGNANYYPMARESWYPNASRGLGDYATYSMTFHVPKGLQLIATGTRQSETTDGKITTSMWKTDVPLPVVGFNLGTFKSKTGEVPAKEAMGLTIDAYANAAPPDSFSGLQGGAVGNFDFAGMLPLQLSEGQVAAALYSRYFGALPFQRVALTQQFACNYGQSWPMLVYLPICGFLDSTQQHFLGLRPEDMYWKVVTPHEVAHQWWGQTVGFRSYRDQWMSEGFANTSATIFLQATRPKLDDFRNFWKEQRNLLTEKNAFGFRPIDVGPVTMGFRLAAQKTGWSVYQDLVYPKGAYILHMIRMMMWTSQGGDARFIAMMHDFVATYRLKAATTEDFKAMVEKYMTPQMDLDGNHRMDWFFNEYVYDTDLPTYHFEGQVSPQGDSASLHIKLVQSGVPPEFKMLVPVYFEFADGKVTRAGVVDIGPSKSVVEQTLTLPRFPSPVKRVFMNYLYDVLCLEN